MPYAQAAAWLGIPADHPFGLGTLPYGSFTTADRPGEQRVGVAIGDHVLDLSAATARLLPGRADLFGTGAAVTMHLPFTVADYVDFYASEQHASNVGRIFRPDAAEPLTANWRHMPIGYHGRAGTVVVSGTPVRRPCGQFRSPGGGGPEFGPCARLDFEAELGFVVGVPSRPGEQVR